MGASGWGYFTPYQPDPEAALQKLRQEVFARGEYYKPWDPVRSHFELMLAQTPPEERASMSPEEWAAREQFLQSPPAFSLPPPDPLPANIEELLAFNAESGTHTILDITRTSDHPAFAAAEPLGDDVLIASYGTNQPTRQQVESCPLAWSQPLENWHAVYFVVYKDGQPDEIVFLGNSGD
jgi:hypothetical protein